MEFRQGAPISDLIANLYLFGFDKLVKAEIDAIGGSYFRYSDDILIIAPIDPTCAVALEKRIRGLIRLFGDELRIKQEKSSILHFSGVGDHQTFRVIFDGQSRSALEDRKTRELIDARLPTTTSDAIAEIVKAGDEGRTTLNGLEYLGFRHSGRHGYMPTEPPIFGGR